MSVVPIHIFISMIVLIHTSRSKGNKKYIYISKGRSAVQMDTLQPNSLPSLTMKIVFLILLFACPRMKTLDCPVQRIVCLVV
jgi:hypothetical protein